jgi:hypothetical protein
MLSFPDPKSFILDICRVNPHQLTPTVGTLGVGIMNLTAFFASSQQQLESQRKPDILWDRRFSTSPTNPYSSLCKLGPGDGPDDWKSELLHWLLGVDSPFRFDEIGSVGRKNCDNGNIRIIGRFFQRGKLAGQFHATEKIEDKIEERDKNMGTLT